jgi:diguanylate cyclase (GGDEF)-like protein
VFDFVEKTFFLPEKKLNEMIRKLRNRGAENKYGILKDFENLMKDFEDTSFIKAFIDERTQLKNYRFYKDVITPVLESDNDICLAVIDIDDFKKINTAFGHDAGDRVIKTVSSIISRFADDACRYGGEEFVFLFKNDVISFQGPCEKIRRAVENEAATAAGIATPVTISIGAAACKEAELIYQGEKERVVFRIADQRLLRAKQSGKNMVIFRD